MFKPSLALMMVIALIGPALARADDSAWPPPPAAALALPAAATPDGQSVNNTRYGGGAAPTVTTGTLAPPTFAPPTTRLSRLPEYAKGIWFQNQELIGDPLASPLRAWEDEAETHPWDDVAGIRSWTEAIEEVLEDFAASQMPLGDAGNLLTVDESSFALWHGATGEATTQSPVSKNSSTVVSDPTWNPTLLFEIMARSDLDHLGGVIDDPTLATWIFRLNFNGDSLPPSLLADICELSDTQ
jgi:hypothetical protein